MAAHEQRTAALSPMALVEQAFGEAIQLTPRARHRHELFDTVSLSPHSATRARQRGITQLQIALILLFGESTPASKFASPHNTVRSNTEHKTLCTRSYWFNHSSRQVLQRALGDQYARICDRTNFYLIVDTNLKRVVTCAHRISRRKRQ